MKLKNLIFAMPLLALGACSGGSSMDDVEYYPVMLEDSESWSFIDSKGQVYMEGDFANEPTCVVDGIFTVYENDGYVVCRFDKKKPQQIKGLEDLKSVGCPNEGLLGIVKPEERIKFVNTKGETKFVLEPIGGKEIVLSLGAFTDGMLLVQNEEGKIGFVDKNGKVAIKPIYDGAIPFNEGYSIAVKNKGDKNVMTVINKKGEDVAKIKSDISIGSGYYDDDEIPHFEYGVIPAYIDNDGNRRVGFLNTKGEFTKLSEKVSHIVEYNSKVVIFTDSEGLYGIITRDGEMIQRPKYEMLSFFGDDQYIAYKDRKYMILDSKGEKIQSKVDDYTTLIALNGKGFFLMGKESSTWALVDKEGNKIGKDEYKAFGTDLSKNNELYSDYTKKESSHEAQEAYEAYEAVEEAVPVAEIGGTRTMEGKIDDKYAIVMTLNINPGSNSVEGSYYYTKYGPSNVMYLRGTCQSLDDPFYLYGINVTEYDKDGKSFGRFEGNGFVEDGDNFGFEGEYINTNGKSMKFGVHE